MAMRIDLLPGDVHGQLRYLDGVEAMAKGLAAALRAEGLRGQRAWDRADQLLPAYEDPARSPHAGLFRDVESVRYSANVEDALDQRPDGSWDWVRGSTESVIRAVVKFDVYRRLCDLHDMECD